MAGINDAPLIESLAVPSVTLLIAFLGYFSQFLFNTSSLQPGPLSQSETIAFNVLLGILYITYFRAVMTDPGSYTATFDDKNTIIDLDESAGGRWCAKCSAPKPLRAHHCRHCARCVPKMDHHCPWTANCVSMTTMPHFLRFLIWTNFTLWTLAYLVYQRFAALWRDRDLPSYLGPTLPALAGLAVVSLVGFVVSVALLIMLISTVKGCLFNQTMIEGWEMERHEALSRRSSRDWWDVVGPDGKQLRFEQVEFPYDIGIWENICQAMGSRNPLWWLSPLAGNPRVSKTGKGAGWEWEENGFNRRKGMWPPPDPDKIRRAAQSRLAPKRDFAAELRKELDGEREEEKRKGGDVREVFRQRQETDLRRRRGRRTAAEKLVAELEEDDDYDSNEEEQEEYDDEGGNDRVYHAGHTGRRRRLGPWVNSDGDRLHDYGVDEDAEAEDGVELPDDEVPLAELINRRKTAKR